MRIKKIIPVRITLGLDELSALEFIDLATHIYKSMKENPYFISPDPPLAKINSQIRSLKNAQSKMRRRMPAKTAIRDKYRNALHDSLTCLAGYIVYTANEQPQNAQTIARSAGVRIRKDAGKPRGFRIQTTGISGEMMLRTDWVRNASFIWQATKTPLIESSWENKAIGRSSKALITGLTPGDMIYFRVAVILRVQGPWSHSLGKRVL